MRRFLIALSTVVLLLSGCSVPVETPPPPRPLTFEETVSSTATSLRDYWIVKTQFISPPYDDPQVLSYDSPDDILCGGTPALLDNARFCTVTNTVSFDINFYKRMYEKYGSIFIYIISGHEYAHSVQFHVDQRHDDPRGFELQADCMSGAYIGEMYRLGRLSINQQDMNKSRTIMYSIGDDVSNPGKPSEPNGHGTGQERYESFANGYTNGVSACRVKDVG